MGENVSAFLGAAEPVLRPLIRTNATLDAVINRVIFESSKSLAEVINRMVSTGELTLKGVYFYFHIATASRDSAQIRRVKGIPLRASLTLSRDAASQKTLVFEVRCAQGAGAPLVVWPLRSRLGLSIVGWDNRVAAYKIVPPDEFINCADEDAGQVYQWKTLKTSVSGAIVNDIVRYRIELLPATST